MAKTPALSTPDRNARNSELRAFWLVTVYVAVVLTVDALASLNVPWPIDWNFWFDWQPLRIYNWLQAQGFSDGGISWLRHPLVRPFWLFKFVFWFLIPFLICVPKMDWGWFGFGRWRRSDYALLAFGLFAGIAILFLIPLIPGLREFYPDLSHLSPEKKQTFFWAQVVRTSSWLLGWEFMHRYWLARHAQASYPRAGWLLVPLFEMLYHLQKHPLEMLGMGAFSLVATWWTLRRRNILLPFMIHLVIELGLALFLIFH